MMKAMERKKIKGDRNAMGRFVKGNKAFAASHRIYTDEVILDLAENLWNWVDEAMASKKLVMLTDWSLKNNISDQQVSRLIKKSPSFAAAHARAKQYQHNTLVHGALTKKYDSRFTQFFLATRHGWTLDKAREDREDTQKSHLQSISEAIHSEGESGEE